MKYQALQSGARITLSKTELSALRNLSRFGYDQLPGSGYHLEGRQAAVAPEILAGLELALSAVRVNSAEAAGKRQQASNDDARRRAHEHHASIDGWNVFAFRSDWIDVSRDPDHRRWADLFHPDTDRDQQGEIRRDAWRVHVSRGRVSDDNYVILGGECTVTNDRAEIGHVAQKLIADHGLVA